MAQANLGGISTTVSSSSTTISLHAKYIPAMPGFRCAIFARPSYRTAIARARPVFEFPPFVLSLLGDDRGFRLSRFDPSHLAICFRARLPREAVAQSSPLRKF